MDSIHLMGILSIIQETKVGQLLLTFHPAVEHTLRNSTDIVCMAVREVSKVTMMLTLGTQPWFYHARKF